MMTEEVVVEADAAIRSAATPQLTERAGAAERRGSGAWVKGGEGALHVAQLGEQARALAGWGGHQLDQGPVNQGAVNQEMVRVGPHEEGGLCATMDVGSDEQDRRGIDLQPRQLPEGMSGDGFILRPSPGSRQGLWPR